MEDMIPSVRAATNDEWCGRLLYAVCCVALYDSLSALVSILPPLSLAIWPGPFFVKVQAIVPRKGWKDGFSSDS